MQLPRRVHVGGSQPLGIHTCPARNEPPHCPPNTGARDRDGVGQPPQHQHPWQVFNSSSESPFNAMICPQAGCCSPSLRMENAAAGGSGTSCPRRRHLSPRPPLPACSWLFLENLCKSFLTQSGRHPGSGSSICLRAINRARQSLQSAPKGI